MSRAGTPDATPSRSAGVRYVTDDQQLVDAVAWLTDSPATATGLWRQLVDPWSSESRLGAAIAAAVRDLGRGRSRLDLHDALEDVHDTALGGRLVDVLVGLAYATDDDRFWRARTTLPKLGSGSPFGIASGLQDIREALRPLEAADTVPRIVLGLPSDFREIETDERRRWCQLVAMLGAACDVRLVCSRINRRWLTEHHRDQLPGVSDCWDQGLGPHEQDAALELVDVGSREERILELLYERDNETLAYADLYSRFTVGDSRVRQVVGSLADVSLVRPFGAAGERRVELTQGGREFYESEIAVQRRLPTRVSETSNPSIDSRVTPRTHEAAPPQEADATAGAGDRHRLPNHHQVRFLGGQEAAAALSTGRSGEINLVNHPIGKQDDRAEGRWHRDGDRLVISAEGPGLLQMWTTLALALDDGRTWDTLLTRKRLDEFGVLSMLEDGREVLLGMRCIGWLGKQDDPVQDYDDLREAFREAADELGEMTKQWQRGEYEGRDRFRGEVVAFAQGLAGSLTHLLDLVDVDLVRQIKLPEFRRATTEDQRQAFAETIVHGTAIASGYGHHTGQRQLFETRDKFRIDPTVDATDPWARLVGSWVLVGDFGSDEALEAFADRLDRTFRGRESREDAPEINIRARIRTRPSRQQVAAAARDVLEQRDLRPTPEAVSALHGLAKTTYDVVDALWRLGDDNDGREVRSAELRYALSTLEPGRLFRGLPGTVTAPRKLLSALLEAEAPLSKTALDQAAGVSADSRLAHLPDLITVGLVEETPRGYRLRLSFGGVGDDDSDERYERRWPTWVSDPEKRPDVHAAAAALKGGRRYHGLADGEPPADGDWSVSGLDLRELRSDTAAVWLTEICPALWGLRCRDTYRDDPRCGRLLDTIDTRAGPRIGQTPLVDASREVTA